MIIHCLYDELVDIKKLKPNPKNRNSHPSDQIERLAKILTYQGWRYPVKVSKRSGFITSGHGRLEAAKKNGWKQVPVNFQDYESDEQEYADLQADNLIALESEMDLGKIQNDVLEFGPEFDVDMLGKLNFHIGPIEFQPGSLDEQDRLDEKKPVTCPNCGEEFHPK